jgi:hypothetical protein
MSLVLAASTFAYADSILTSESIPLTLKMYNSSNMNKEDQEEIIKYNQEKEGLALKKARLQIQHKCEGQLNILKVDSQYDSSNGTTMSRKITVTAYCVQN